MNTSPRRVRRLGVALVIASGFPVLGLAQPHIVPDPLDPPTAAPPAVEVLIGKALFFDTTLSTPSGTSCGSCHDAGAAWSDPRSVADPYRFPTSESASRGRYGSRNSLTTLYADLGPSFFFDPLTGSYVGGRYWDGRAADTASQAGVPFTSPVEMNNPSTHSVINKLRKTTIAPLFELTYGPGIWHDDAAAMRAITTCLAAYQADLTGKAFRSRFDRFLAGDVTSLSADERAGKALFEGKGGCSACHASALRPDARPPLFTTYRFYNLGVPRNPANPFYEMPTSINPEGAGFADKGLGGILGLASEEGKFKVPSLRNVAGTPPYMHNGVFTDLMDAVMFHNTRDVDRRWGVPETPANLAYGPVRAASFLVTEGGPTQPPDDGTPGGLATRLGNLGLTQREVEQIVAFLGTLNDEPRLTP